MAPRLEIDRVYGAEAMRWRLPLSSAALLAVAAFACSSSSVTRGPSTITNTSDDVGADVPVRVTSQAVKPSLLHLFNGFRATFVNEDSVARTLGMDAARSELAGCSAVAVGTIQPGETRTTDPLPRFASCYFRDAQRPGDAAFQGVVVTH